MEHIPQVTINEPETVFVINASEIHSAAVQSLPLVDMRTLCTVLSAEGEVVSAVIVYLLYQVEDLDPFLNQGFMCKGDESFTTLMPVQLFEAPSLKNSYANE